MELGRWDDTLVLTYAEFGRRPKENQNNGTDHGTANVHFALGGRVTGGLFGEAPDLTRADGEATPRTRSTSAACTRACSNAGGASFRAPRSAADSRRWLIV